jgi:hypothetical protein
MLARLVELDDQALTVEPDAAVNDLRALYASDPRLHTRPDWWKAA